jgi:DNA-directed RNA polymerase subunit E'/Rpb7
MEHTVIFKEQVELSPRDMRGKIESIDNIVKDKLQARLESRCSRHGYVIPGSIKVLSRAMGILEKGRFTGSFIFHVNAEGNVLNPPDGVIIEGEVIRKNKMGMYISYHDAIRVIVPRDLHIGDDMFEGVEIGDMVLVEIKKSRFQVNDPYILSVGIFRESKGKKAASKQTPKEPEFGESEEVEPGLGVKDDDLIDALNAAEDSDAEDAEDEETGEEEVE